MPGVMLLRCLLITFRTEVVFTNLGIYGDEVCGRVVRVVVVGCMLLVTVN